MEYLGYKEETLHFLQGFRRDYDQNVPTTYFGLKIFSVIIFLFFLGGGELKIMHFPTILKKIYLFFFTYLSSLD